MTRPGDEFACWQPRTLDECLRLMRAHPQAALLAGATAAQLGWPAQRPWSRPDAPIIDLHWLVRDAARDSATCVEGADTQLLLPALASLESLRRSALLSEHLPAVSQLLNQVASAGVRRLATLGGNLCWPAGDLRVPLLVLDVDYHIADPVSGLVRDRSECPSRGLLLAVVVRGLSGLQRMTVEKIGYRAAFSPSLITLAIARVHNQIRVAVGGGATPAQRLPQTEAGIQQGFEAARLMAVVRSELRSAGDAMASSAERIDVAARWLAGHAAGGYARQPEQPA